MKLLTLILLLPILLAVPSCSTSGGNAGNANVQPAPKPASATTVHQTIVVAAGKTFDGGGRAYKAGKKLGDGSQAEGQDPVFLLEPGATLKNVVIAKPAADGVHVKAAAGKTTRVLNCIWTDVGEDALTVMAGNNQSKVLVDSCRFYHADDKVVQVNATAWTTLQNCEAADFGRFARSNGAHGSTDPLAYRIDIEGGQFKDGDTILKMSSPNAQGTVQGIRTTNIKTPIAADNGAKITVSP